MGVDLRLRGETLSAEGVGDSPQRTGCPGIGPLVLNQISAEPRRARVTDIADLVAGIGVPPPTSVCRVRDFDEIVVAIVLEGDRATDWIGSVANAIIGVVCECKDAARRARAAGLEVVMDRCILQDHMNQSRR